MVSNLPIKQRPHQTRGELTGAPRLGSSAQRAFPDCKNFRLARYSSLGRRWRERNECERWWEGFPFRAWRRVALTPFFYSRWRKRREEEEEGGSSGGVFWSVCFLDKGHQTRTGKNQGRERGTRVISWFIPSSFFLVPGGTSVCRGDFKKQRWERDNGT